MSQYDKTRSAAGFVVLIYGDVRGDARWLLRVEISATSYSLRQLHEDSSQRFVSRLRVASITSVV